VVRRRLATDPPDYDAVFEEPDDGEAFGADGSDGTPGDGPRKRAMRVRLALAALPLATAIALFAVTGLDGGSAPAPAQDAAVAGESGLEGASLDPSTAPGALEARVPSDVAEAADAAAVAGTLAGRDPARTFPGRRVDENGAGGDTVDGNGADAWNVPTAPSGHRPVAIRIADPAALSLVAAGDEVDVVGMDGSVLAEHLQVLQDRSSGTGSVLVLASPNAASAALAAATLSREVTVILSAEPAFPESGP
jgi:hypothetical protein